jgi:hypothetical protein
MRRLREEFGLELGHLAPPEERARYREEQRAAILRALGRYNRS